MSGDTRRKMLAVAAGGLVLGVGAAVTLAAWNDSEFASSTFTAGAFNLEGATDDAAGTYADHAGDAAGAAELTFTVPLAGDIAPGDVVYAPFWVRLDDATTSPGTLTAADLSAVDTSGANAAQLSHAVYAIAPDAACDATAAAAGTLVTDGPTLESFSSTAAPVALAAGAPGVAGEPVQLCFAVTAGEGLEQGGVTEATWSFTATSS